MPHYKIIWPEGFDDYAWEVESKGCLFGAKIKIGSQVFEPAIYDKVRLSQDVESDLSNAGYFAARAIIVLQRVTKSEIERVIEEMDCSGVLKRLYMVP